MRKNHTVISVILVVLSLGLCTLFTSCQGIMGYSVVLWNIPEHNVADGTIVPVYIKSNVSHIYVVRLPGEKEKVEIPLWQISEPQSHHKAKKLVAKYKAYEHVYAHCTLDGLPIRADRVNTAKQVYRLRKDEVVRPLYEESGAAVMTGKNAIEGKWLRVLTKDGTVGWCFSYNLKLFKMNADGTVAEGSDNSSTEVSDETLEKLLAAKWYPESYSSMIQSGNIDLQNMNKSFGFDTGVDSNKVAMRLNDLDVEYEYAGVTKTDDNVYKFNDTPFQVTVRSDSFIVVQYTDDSGIPKSYNFITLEDDIEALIAEEVERRSEEYLSLRQLGPDFRSGNYGTLTFEESNGFKWTGYDLLVPSLIPNSAQSDGKIQLKYLLDKSLKSNWDGVLTFVFDGMENEVNFLYKKESNGLRLEDATHADFEGNTVESRDTNALVIFFAN